MVTYPDAVRVADHDGQLPFHYLLQGNYLCQENPLVPLMDLFIEAHPSCINVANDSGMTPLFIAMTHVGNTGFSVILHLLRLCPESAHHIVRFFLEKDLGAARSLDSYGYIPLHCACCGDAPPDLFNLLIA